MNPEVHGIAGLLEEAAKAWPGAAGLGAPGGGTWGYPESAARAAALAQALRDRRVSPGDVVAWLGDNSAHAALAYFGAAWAGVVLAPLHARATDADLARHLEHARARVLLCDRGALARASALAASALDVGTLDAGASGPRPERVDPSAPAHLYYTSGSTGAPKGVVLTHGNVVSHARLAAAALDLGPSDVWLHAAPMFHLADAWATFAVTLVGGSHRFVPRFATGPVLDAFASGVTATNLVPTMWDSLVRDPTLSSRRYPSLRLLLSGGSAIAPDLVRRVRSAFAPAEYAQTYGLTETSPFLTVHRAGPGERWLSEDDLCRLLARVGPPMAGVDVRVAGPDGEPVPGDDATVGEVWARGPTVTPGYLRNPEADAAAFAGGWFRTGDLARVDASGRLDLVDRTKDVIHTGGEKVFSVEVERALAGLPGAREVAVVATADAHWGEVVTAVVVPEGDPPDLARVQAHARARLAGWQIPRRLVLVEALPRTASGKVEKRTVRALAQARVSASTTGPEPGATTPRIGLPPW